MRVAQFSKGNKGMHIRQIRIVPILLIVLLVFLQYRLWFDSSGIMAMVRIKKEVSQQEEANQQLKRLNDDLTHEIDHLHTDPESIETRARAELGMIKKDETFYQVVE